MNSPSVTVNGHSATEILTCPVSDIGSGLKRGGEDSLYCRVLYAIAPYTTALNDHNYHAGTQHELIQLKWQSQSYPMSGSDPTALTQNSHC